MKKKTIPKGDVRERLKAIKNIIINSPHRTRILGQIAQCHQGVGSSSEPDCMCIFGPAGVGKTTLADEYIQGFPIREEKQQRVVPVLVLTAPSPATVKGLATDFLVALGDPAAEKGAIPSLNRRIRMLIISCKVELIILDELQHFGDNKTAEQMSPISNWLKNLINYCKLPIVIMGMPNAEEILNANDQLKRRFEIIQRLEHFTWNNDQGRRFFRSFLKMLEDELPLPQQSHLSREDIALRIFCATGGRLGYVVRLLRRAAGRAVLENLDFIDLDLLAATFAETLSTLVPNPNGENPFLDQIENMDAWLGLATTILPGQSTSKGTNRRVTGKPFVPKASIILKGHAK